MAPTFVRLNKRLAELGLCSRREADSLIPRGLVLVNGVVRCVLGTKVRTADTVELLGAGLKEQESRATLLINKPIGFVSAHPVLREISAISLISENSRCKQSAVPEVFAGKHISEWTKVSWIVSLLNLFVGSLLIPAQGLAPCGRLDRDSRGLLVLSSDGTIARKIISPNANMEKEYEVEYKGRLEDDDLHFLQCGMVLDGCPLRAAFVERMGPNKVRMILKQGRNRQIRRMLQLVGCEAIDLARVRIGNIRLEGLAVGSWRFLQANENF